MALQMEQAVNHVLLGIIAPTQGTKTLAPFFDCYCFMLLRTAFLLL